MKIYTKTGDKGETGLFGGGRVRKDSPRIAAYGEVDHLNSVVGVVRALKPEPKTDEVLDKIQNILFEIGAALASPSKKSGMVTQEDSGFLEKEIDRMQEDLPPLKNFILPGGNLLGAVLHEARTVCRRAEREIVSLSDREPVDSEILATINRLSDYLFVLARWANKSEGVADKEWKKK